MDAPCSLIVGGLISAVLVGHPDDPLWRSMLLSCALKATYWLAALALRRLRFDPAFGKPSDVARFAVVMLLAGLLSAGCGVGYAVAFGNIALAQVGRATVIFWMGDLLAVLALTPMLLAGLRLLEPGRKPRRGQKLIGLQGILQILSFPATLLFAYLTAPRLGFLAFGVGFLPLGWIAVTQGVAGATVMSAALDVGAIAARSWADPRWPGLLPGAYATLFVRDSGQGMMGGHRLSRALRDRGSSLLMLLTSGFAGPEVFPDGRRVLQKPLQTATLAAALAEALGVRGALGG